MGSIHNTVYRTVRVRLPTYVANHDARLREWVIRTKMHIYRCTPKECPQISERWSEWTSLSETAASCSLSLALSLTLSIYPCSGILPRIYCLCALTPVNSRVAMPPARFYWALTLIARWPRAHSHFLAAFWPPGLLCPGKVTKGTASVGQPSPLCRNQSLKRQCSGHCRTHLASIVSFCLCSHSCLALSPASLSVLFLTSHLPLHSPSTERRSFRRSTTRRDVPLCQWLFPT